MIRSFAVAMCRGLVVAHDALSRCNFDGLEINPPPLAKTILRFTAKSTGSPRSGARMGAWGRVREPPGVHRNTSHRLGARGLDPRHPNREVIARKLVRPGI